MKTVYRTPLGRETEEPAAMSHWNRLADAIASPGWIHQGVDDRYGSLTFASTNPSERFLAPMSGGVEVIHVEHALALYERIYGKPFTEVEARTPPVDPTSEQGAARAENHSRFLVASAVGIARRAFSDVATLHVDDAVLVQKRLEQLAKRVDDLEAALGCILDDQCSLREWAPQLGIARRHAAARSLLAKKVT